MYTGWAKGEVHGMYEGLKISREENTRRWDRRADFLPRMLAELVLVRVVVKLFVLRSARLWLRCTFRASSLRLFGRCSWPVVVRPWPVAPFFAGPRPADRGRGLDSRLGSASSDSSCSCGHIRVSYHSVRPGPVGPPAWTSRPSTGRWRTSGQPRRVIPWRIATGSAVPGSPRHHPGGCRLSWAE